jgi:hypothetical protein
VNYMTGLTNKVLDFAALTSILRYIIIRIDYALPYF